MQGFLTALIECSISMSVLVLSFIVITPRLSKKYNAKWLYYAWLVIVIGLIIPFRFHPNTALIQIDTTSTYIQQIMPRNVVDITGPAIQSDIMHQELMAIPLYQIAFFIWVIGAIAFIIYHGLNHYHFIRIVNRWSDKTTDPQLLEIIQSIKEDMGIARQVGLQICSCISSPMMIGFVNPVILLPRMSFSADELSLILRHELVHFKRRDLWYKSLVLLATAIHWFNPVIYVMAKAIAVQCEISCDAEVVKGTDMNMRKQYIETIIGAIKNQSRMQTIFSTNFYGGKKGMKKRMLSIMDTTKKKAGAFLLCSIIIGTIGTGVVLASSNKTIDNQGAYSTDAPISAQEQEKIDQQSREKIAEIYSIYAKYGLTYDQETDSFQYDGKLVRFFSDKLDKDGTYNSFTRPNGVIDLKAVRNSKNKLIRISTVSREEYDKRTKSMERAQTVNAQESAQENNATYNNINGSASAVESGDKVNAVKDTTSAFSEGDPNYMDNSLSAYTDYGVSYDKPNKRWIFNNKPIHFLSDGENATFVDNSANAIKNGVSLEVIRNVNGQIDKLVEIAD